MECLSLSMCVCASIFTQLGIGSDDKPGVTLQENMGGGKYEGGDRYSIWKPPAGRRRKIRIFVEFI